MLNNAPFRKKNWIGLGGKYATYAHGTYAGFSKEVKDDFLKSVDTKETDIEKSKETYKIAESLIKSKGGAIDPAGKTALEKALDDAIVQMKSNATSTSVIVDDKAAANAKLQLIATTLEKKINNVSGGGTGLYRFINMVPIMDSLKK